MGNAKSQPCRPRRPLYLFYLIHRTWSVVVEHRGVAKEEPRYEDTDHETDLTSRCSGCPDCGYRRESISFDSESEMAPNAEEELLAVKPWGPQPEKQQERLRPPTYNAEDYAVALRRWGRRPIASTQETHNGTLPSTTSSSSGYASGSGEMTLRQFTSVSELLNKLRADLRLAFPSFVQEFASSPADGITLLLETLRGVQLAQNSPPSGQVGPKIGTRRAALDELGCVECLAACGERCADAPRLLIEAQPGLLALAVCLTSSLNRSRVLALQLLTRVCQAPGGHAAVSEAVSTLRLRYGEGGRFRFLAGALLAPRAAIVLRVAGVSFLNAFIRSAPRAQTKLYIQAEACEAGLEPKILQEWLSDVDSNSEDSLSELLRKEVHRWSKNCVDVESLQKRALRAEETCRMLGKKILALQSQIEGMQVASMNGYNASSNGVRDCDKKQSRGKPGGKVSSSSNANDDEGISSSERSSTPDELKRGGGLGDSMIKLSVVEDNDEETTIDDVIEELRIIVKDAEEEYEDNNSPQGRNNPEGKNSVSDQGSKTQKFSAASPTVTNSCSERSLRRCDQSPVTYFGGRGPLPEDYNCSDSLATRKLSSGHSTVSKSSAEGSLKILVKGPDIEEAIVPAIIHPQPPKRNPPCLTAILAARNCAFADAEEGEEIDEETLGDGSDSLLSASRLKYAQNEPSSRGFVAHQGDGKLAKSCEDITRDKCDKKTIRNYDSSMILSCKTDNRRGEFAGQKSRSQSSAQGRRKYGSSRCSGEIEKRKLLRRTSSQDCLQRGGKLGRDQRELKRSESGIKGRIRKFESLNSIENLSLSSFSRPGSAENFRDELNAGRGIKGAMKRSESFHQVSLGKRQEPSSRGGSDAGLFYVTNFDLEPVIQTLQQQKTENSKTPNLLTKSLDRIDEGLDSMVDIVLTEDKQLWIENEARLRKNDKQGGDRRQKNGKIRGDIRREGKKEQIKSDEFYNGFCSQSTGVITKQLRSDELYSDKHPQSKINWSYENELHNARKSATSYSAAAANVLDNAPAILSNRPGSGHGSFCLEKTIGSKFSNEGSNESGIYLPGRSHDAFGLSKNRFNAGKYSGNNLSSVIIVARENSQNGNKNSSIVIPSSNGSSTKHGKVTDVVSGLY